MTDLSRAVSAPGITAMAYDNADGILYLSVMSGEVLRYNPTIAQFLAPIEVGGDLSSIAVSPDGSFLLVGNPALTSDGHGGYNAIIDRVSLSSPSIDQLTVPVPNGAENLFDGVMSLIATNNGQGFAVIFGQAWQFSAAAATPTFNLTPTLLNAAPSTAALGRYLIETAPWISPSPLEVVDTQTSTTSGPINLDNAPVAIDVSPTTGQVAALTYPGEVSLYDRNLTLEQHLNSSAISGDFLQSLHYSADGQSLFVLDGSKDSVIIFNAISWTETGSIGLPAGALAFPPQPEQTSISPDGRFLFVQTTGGIVSVDLSAHPSSVAAAATGTSAAVDPPIFPNLPPVARALANTTEVTGIYTVGAGQNQVFDETQSPPYELSPGVSITFDDQGQVHVNSSVANADLEAVIDDGQLSGPALVKVSAGGELEVDATGSGSSAIGYVSPQFSGSVENDGTWLVSGVATAAGVARLYSPFFGGATFTNTGDFEVDGSTASGVSGTLGSFSNSGQFSVSGNQAFGVSGASTVSNSGTLSVTANDHHAVAIQGAFTINNSGIITADVAIAAPTDPGIAGAFTPPLVIDNSGTINGVIDLGLVEELLYQPNGVLGADITNTGAINGAIHFDDGNVTYDGVGGTQTGGIYLGEGTDHVLLGNDGETVHDNSGYDDITGGSGNDTVFAGPGDANFDGGAGADTLAYGSTYTAAAISQTASGYTVSGPDGVDTLSSVEIVQFADQQMVLDSVGETLTARGGGDTLIGGAGGDTLRGQAGDDVISGQGGNDYLEGGDGNDTIDGGGGFNIAAYASASAAVVVNLGLQGVAQDTQGAGIDTISNAENVIGSDFNDDLSGDAQTNALYGGNGNDTLRGQAGDDNLFGQAGNDYIEGGDGNDVIDGGSGFNIAAYATASHFVVLDLAMRGQWQDTQGAGGDFITNVENLIGSSYDDNLSGDGQTNVIYGGDGNDTLYGRAGDDNLFGQNGSDYIDGGDGNDVIDGGAGFNVAAYGTASHFVVVDLAMQGGWQDTQGAGNDWITNVENLVGSNFDDTLFGDGLTNVIYGGNGNDTLYGRGGDDNLFGQAGNDYLEGGDGNDVIDGGAGFNLAAYATASHFVVLDLGMQGQWQDTQGAGNDFITNVENLIGSDFDDNLTGDGQDNVIYGGNGNDTLYGKAGNDKLFGGAGNDYIDGGSGDDSLAGNSGADAFVFDTSFGHDTVTDFTATGAGHDRILLLASMFADFAAVQSHMTQSGPDVVISDGLGDTLTLSNLLTTDLTAGDFTFV